MDINGEIRISPKYKLSDYKDLKLDTDSSAQDLDRAIEIFDDRINGWYFKAIEKLLDIEINDKDKYINISEKCVLNFGFASMAIMCLIIETLYQFREGIDKTDKGENKKKYSEFLQKYIKCFKGKKDLADKFYSYIRCGILHSGETKGQAILTSTLIGTGLINNVLSVSVEDVYKSLKEYYYEYLSELKDFSQTEHSNERAELRKNFIKKMDLICDNA